MKNKNTVFTFIIGAACALIALYTFSNYKIVKKKDKAETTQVSNENSRYNQQNNANQSSNNQNSDDITAKTNENVVADYIKQNHRLPDYYITKSEARNQGWNPSKGNLCNAIPGKAIGGDKFSNRERVLPDGDRYFEADVNFECGHRQTDRLIFTKNGDVWVTHDHYKTFNKK
jgi:hypothetical protein